MFDMLVHADWSVTPKKRWMCVAERSSGRWQVQSPSLVGPVPDFLNRSFEQARVRRILLGFDFPIGLPHSYGLKTGLPDFKSALGAFGEKEWKLFYEVAAAPDEIAVQRPFYPKSSTKGHSQAALFRALGFNSMRELMRGCELGTAITKAACCVFWTLGGNQVGKGALSGWREVIGPGIARGARLWPFDGTLTELTAEPGIVLAETYPAQAYHLLGASFRSSESKRQQHDRRSKAKAIIEWASRKRVDLERLLNDEIVDGFGTESSGEDRFDAFMGLAKMIEVAKGRPERSLSAPPLSSWEGWILAR